MRNTRTPHSGPALTPADRVTLTRAALGAVCAVLVALGLSGVLPARSWALFLVAAVAALLDAVDGAVARRTGTVTRRGARWDMETDAALLAVLSIGVAPWAPWALGIGAARYLFWFGARVRPAWRAPLPSSRSRRVVAGLQAAALVTALAPFLPLWVGQSLTAPALALLVVSFGRDIGTLERRARHRVRNRARRRARRRAGARGRRARRPRDAATTSASPGGRAGGPPAR